MQTIRNKPPAEMTMNDQQALLNISNLVRKNVTDVVNILKKASEIEVLLASRFDSVQVITLLEQVPELILSEVSSLVLTITSSIEH